MNNLWTRIVGDKREWRAMEARAAALPRDHRIVYSEIKRYLWRFTSGDGSEILTILGGVLQSFESAAAHGESVLSVTGEDIAAFCDDRLHGAFPAYLDSWRTSLNSEVAAKLAG